MSRIIAKGKLNGVKKEVQCFMEDGSVIIEIAGEFDETIQNKFSELIKDAPAIGGTYYPPENSMLAALAVLESSFFDSLPNIMIQGDIGEIPTYDIEDIVY